MCPFFRAAYNTCKFFDTYQEGYQKEHYCQGSDWQNCANYYKRSSEEKLRAAAKS
ncbi:MAG: hypothetical protein LBH98_09175 [Chitinispirillales bacterium]|jgi:hypothetical protein|nr:hypothetical protein [Chitinispirillales bacterium]